MPFLSDRGEVEQEVTTPRGHGYRDLADLSGQNHPVWLGDIGPAGVFFEYRASDEIPRLSPQPLKASSFVDLEDAVLIGYGERDRRAVEAATGKSMDAMTPREAYYRLKEVLAREGNA